MTRTSPPGSRSRSRSSGFTLVEVLVVMLLLMISATLVAPRLAASLAGLESRRAVGDFVHELRRARTDALTAGRTVRLHVEERTLLIAGPAADDPPREWEFPTQFALGEGGFPDRLDFYPAGNSSGGRIVVLIGEETRTIEVDPLTGEVLVRQSGG